jgi:hypothetical protein
MDRQIVVASLAGVAAVLAAATYFSQAESKPKTKPTLKLSYFDTPGKAECMRLICAYANLPLEDIRVNKDDWPAMKKEGKLNFGQLPALEIENGIILSQSAAITRYLGKLSGLYPTCPVAAALVDSIMDTEGDMTQGLLVSRYNGDFTLELGSSDRVSGGLRCTVRLRIRDRVHLRISV